MVWETIREMVRFSEKKNIFFGSGGRPDFSDFSDFPGFRHFLKFWPDQLEKSEIVDFGPRGYLNTF